MEQWAIRSNDSLQHYGVKGMKWGVRNEKKVSSNKPSTSLDKQIYRTKDKKNNIADYQKKKASGVLPKVKRVSNEYRQELEYNSRKNSFSSSKSGSDSSSSNVSSARSGGGVSYKSGEVSEEYLEELAYNSQKNTFLNDNVTKDTKVKNLKKTPGWKDAVDKGKTTVSNAISSIKSKIKGAAQSAGEYISKVADSGKKWLEKTFNVKKVKKTTKVIIDDSPAKKKNALEKLFNIKESDQKVTRWTTSGKEEYIRYKKNK